MICMYIINNVFVSAHVPERNGIFPSAPMHTLGFLIDKTTLNGQESVWNFQF